MTLRFLRTALPVIVAAMCLADRPDAQQAPAGAPPASPPAPTDQAPVPTFRGGIDSVSVDVIVTDKQGKAVTDLKPEDFEIREAGKPQTVQSFKLVQVDDGYEDVSAQREILSVADHEREVASERNRLLVIFLDDYHVRIGNSLVIRQQLANFVNQLAPHDLVALTMPLLPASAITFSRGKEGIASQLMNFMGRKYNYMPKYPLEFRYEGEPPIVQERLRNMWTIAGLRNLAEYMAAFRVGRKTILYVSEGMSNTMPAGVLTTGSQWQTIPTVGAAPTDTERNRNLMESMELISDLQRVFSAAARTNTSIYTIDPRGLAPTEFSAADVVALTEDKLMLNQTTEMLRTIAENTDGRAIVNRNDPLPSLKQMIQDGSTYYLIGYTSSSQFRDGKFHEIQVRVKRKDVDVRARRGYWAASAEDASRMSAPKVEVAANVSEALDTLANVTESSRRQPVTVWMAATRGAAEKAKVTFVWEAAADPSVPAERVDHLTVTANSIYGDALFSGRLDRDVGSSTPGGVLTFDAPAGSVQVKIEVQNATGRRLVATDASIEVPDFTATSAQITTPFVFRGRTARDLQAVRAAAAPMPTTLRAFSRGERLLLRFEAYGPGGNVPTVTMKILNQNGSTVATMPAPTQNGNVFESEFGLGAFPPSDYLLEITADAKGDVAKKLVAIRVTGS